MVRQDVVNPHRHRLGAGSVGGCPSGMMVQKVPPQNADSHDKILQTVVRRLGALVVEILIGRVACFPRAGYGLVVL